MIKNKIYMMYIIATTINTIHEYVYHISSKKVIIRLILSSIAQPEMFS